MASKEVVTHNSLMESSWERVDALAHTGTPDQQLIVSRIIDSPRAWRRWEAAHARLMRNVAEEHRAPKQLMVLRSTALSLIHRKALFEYMRVRRITGRARHTLMTQFYGVADYAHAMVQEHDAWLRSACSHMCSTYVGVDLMKDGIFDEPLMLYEEQYSEYFQSFCDTSLAGDSDEKQLRANRALLPYLKRRLEQTRSAILRSPRLSPQAQWEKEMRQPTGDTLKLKSITLMQGEPR